MSEKCQDSCQELEKLEKRVDAIQNRVREVELTNAKQDERHKAIMEKLDSMADNHKELIGKLDSVERISLRQSQSIEEMNERGKNNQKRLDIIEAKPGKRWEGIVEKAIWAFAASVIALLLAKLGLPT